MWYLNRGGVRSADGVADLRSIYSRAIRELEEEDEGDAGTHGRQNASLHGRYEVRTRIRESANGKSETQRLTEDNARNNVIGGSEARLALALMKASASWKQARRAQGGTYKIVDEDAHDEQVVENADA